MWILILNEVLQWLAIAFLFYFIVDGNKNANHNFRVISNQTSHLRKY